MIQLINLQKRYGTGEIAVDVLKGIDLEISEGEYLSIMGPSGSGKSTLMNIIGCLDRQTEGRYLFQGQDVSEADEEKRARLRNQNIGFVFQHFQLLSRMNARQNVELPLIYAGMSPARRQKLAKEALERVGLSDRMEHLPSELSGGQQQRVAIARALVNRPPLLLADEPTGALDTASGEVVLKLFEELHQDGCTVVMITHDPEVSAHAERQVLIRDGALVEDRRFAEEGGVG
ncbi:ABC transporter ATP-binding protein [Melghirimyces algeriensis]|uniref:Putative ABC transport system ATP-binding protein n=1 Tax=Melghirimyces algeriensis TaxID=910412 RepID=A0A521E8N0_9BACL|nr:ABC transporter ATP-binding protein [Melghirimyces algeriensis]SMO80298.1 putative ABC transport system ATP-binding protein [Melghirimyces algeriensis]